MTDSTKGECAVGLVTYGDFSEAPSRVAARYADQLFEAGIDLEWRAVTRSPLGDVRPSCAALAALQGRRAHELRHALFVARWESMLDVDDPNVLERVLGEAPVFDEARAQFWQRAWQGIEDPDLPLVRLTTGYVFRGDAGVAQLRALAARRGGERRRRTRRRGAVPATP
jgi:hypothetical protein